MQKKLIPFNKSMTQNKRANWSAYLRSNLLNIETKGLYPSVNFRKVVGFIDSAGNLIHPVAFDFIVGHIVTQVPVAGFEGVMFYRWNGSTGESTIPLDGIFQQNEIFVDGVKGNDGIRWVSETGSVYKIVENSGGGWAGGKITLTPKGTGTAITSDGLFYFFFANNKIYRILGAHSEVAVFDTFMPVSNAFAFNEQIFFITKQQTNFTINIWGKASATLLDNRVIVHNARLLACGDIDGTAIFVTVVGNVNNIKEKSGEIVVSAFDGQKLVKLNSIRIGNRDVQVAGAAHLGNKGFSIGNGIMIVGLIDNVSIDNTELYNNFVLKIEADGSIETIFDVALANTNPISMVSIEHDFITVGLTNGEFYFGIDNALPFDYSLFSKNSVYITPFLDFSSELKKMGGIGVSFEKLHNNPGERLQIFYRVSERDDWLTIGEITPAIVAANRSMRMSQSDKDLQNLDINEGLSPQSFEFSRGVNGQAFIEYNEVQFKFVSNFGFSVINAWYYSVEQKRSKRL